MGFCVCVHLGSVVMSEITVEHCTISFQMLEENAEKVGRNEKPSSAILPSWAIFSFILKKKKKKRP